MLVEIIIECSQFLHCGSPLPNPIAQEMLPQVNNQKRPKLNHYVPPSTSQLQQTVSAGRFICRLSPSSTLQSSQFAGPEDGSTEFDFAMFDEPSMSMDAGEDGTMAQSQKCKCTAGQSLLVWIKERDTYFSEIIRLDGHGENARDTYPGCCTDPARFQCQDCNNMQLYCGGCSLANHARSPTHRIQEWNSVFFEDHYDGFMRMVHEWQHLTMLKRFGRGHDPSGVDGTLEGECVVLCPACPQPGKNLPNGWETAAKAKWCIVLWKLITIIFSHQRELSVEEAEHIKRSSRPKSFKRLGVLCQREGLQDLPGQTSY
ncbi:hypothetical protein BDR03DRAFT_988121 [Suillus americanus]|nr:hypothetical protein BDR03DRAFT_988121 [Suillus americanus]